MFLALASCTSKQGDKKYQTPGMDALCNAPRVQPVRVWPAKQTTASPTKLFKGCASSQDALIESSPQILKQYSVRGWLLSAQYQPTFRKCVRMHTDTAGELKIIAFINSPELMSFQQGRGLWNIGFWGHRGRMHKHRRRIRYCAPLPFAELNLNDSVSLELISPSSFCSAAIAAAKVGSDHPTVPVHSLLYPPFAP